MTVKLYIVDRIDTIRLNGNSTQLYFYYSGIPSDYQYSYSGIDKTRFKKLNIDCFSIHENNSNF